MSDLVRPYVVTGGRTRASDASLRMETMVQAAHEQVDGIAFEAASILALCDSPRSIAEIASGLELPLGVVMVLVADLADSGYLVIHHSDPVDIELSVLTRMIDRVRSL